MQKINTCAKIYAIRYNMVLKYNESTKQLVLKYLQDIQFHFIVHNCIYQKL